MTTVTITEQVVAVTATTTGATVSVTPQTVSVGVAPGLIGNYANLDTANTFNAGPNLFLDGGIGIAGGTPQTDSGGGRGHDTYVHVADTITSMQGDFPTRHFIEGMNVELTLADTSNLGSIDATLQGYRGAVYIDPTSTTVPQNIYGLNFSTETDADVAVPTMYGVNTSAYQGGGGTIDELAVVAVYGDNFGSGRVNEFSGVYIQSMNDSGGPVTTLAGLLIDDQTGAADATYAIKTGAGAVHFGDYLEMPEISTPAAPGTNTARLFVRDNGGGKSQLCVRFPSGNVQVLSTEP